MRIDTTEELRLALKASVDVRTLRKAMRGEAIKGRAGDRARRVLKDAGFRVPRIRSEPAEAATDTGQPVVP